MVQPYTPPSGPISLLIATYKTTPKRLKIIIGLAITVPLIIYASTAPSYASHPYLSTATDQASTDTVPKPIEDSSSTPATSFSTDPALPFVQHDTDLLSSSLKVNKEEEEEEWQRLKWPMGPEELVGCSPEGPKSPKRFIGGWRVKRRPDGVEEREFKIPDKSELVYDSGSKTKFCPNLYRDLRYVTSSSYYGFTSQFLVQMRLLYYALLTQRIAILPVLDTEHVEQAEPEWLSKLFDLDALRRKTGIPIVEWRDIKDLKLKGDTEPERMGCWQHWSNNFIAFHRFNVNPTPWPLPPSLQQHRKWDIWRSFQALAQFDWDNVTRADWARKSIEKERRESGFKGWIGRGWGSTPDEEVTEVGRVERNLFEDGLMCYDNMYWSMSPHWEDEPTSNLYPSDQRPSKAPDWDNVGRHLNFTQDFWDVATEFLPRIFNLGRGEPIPDFITVHIRRGDFKDRCKAGKDCFTPLSSYSEGVSTIRAKLPASISPDSLRVLVTTDETDPEFLSDIKENLRWSVVDHAELDTLNKFREEKGWGEQCWWTPPILDQLFLSLGKGFVGSWDSTVSQVAAMRVETWNGGVTMIANPPDTW